MSRMNDFNRIKNFFLAQDEKLMKKGRLPMRGTEVGFWGCSNLDDVYEFFTRKKFSNNTKFIDLGCGDGRVVLTASLFVDAQGIEWDEELVLIAKKAIGEMELNCVVNQGDIRDVDISCFDIIYMYADQRFDFIKEKLLAELKGKLYIYHNTYKPYFLKKEKTIWINQIPIFCYTNNK